MKLSTDKSLQSPKTTDVLNVIWDSFPQEAINSLTKKLKACVLADGGHFQHLMLHC